MEVNTQYYCLTLPSLRSLYWLSGLNLLVFFEFVFSLCITCPLLHLDFDFCILIWICLPVCWVKLSHAFTFVCRLHFWQTYAEKELHRRAQYLNTLTEWQILLTNPKNQFNTGWMCCRHSRWFFPPRKYFFFNKTFFKDNSQSLHLCQQIQGRQEIFFFPSNQPPTQYPWWTQCSLLSNRT